MEYQSIMLGGAAGIAIATGLFGYCIGKHRPQHKNAFEEYLFKSHLYQDKNPLLKYVTEKSLKLHPVLKKLIALTMAHSSSHMMGAPEVLNLIGILIKMLNAKKALDVGVFTGCSALAEALALPDDGKVIGCEVSEEFVNLGRPFWEEAKVAHKIDVRFKPAVETLDQLIENGESDTFDFAFIDADKPNYLKYYEKCLLLIRQGGIIVVDNTLWGAKVIDITDQDPRTIAVRTLNDRIFNDDRVEVSLLTIADGVSIVRKL